MIVSRGWNFTDRRNDFIKRILENSFTFSVSCIC